MSTRSQPWYPRGKLLVTGHTSYPTVTALSRETAKRNTDSEIQRKTKENQRKTKENKEKQKKHRDPGPDQGVSSVCALAVVVFHG